MGKANETWYRKLRWEHKKRKDDGTYAEKLGTRCANCGSEEQVVYHHIVPLSAGGTNRISNIVPLCSQCHKAVHFIHSREYYSKDGGMGGRPSTASPERWDEVLSEYACCKIGQSEAKALLNRSQGSPLVDAVMYKTFLKEHGIKKIKNLIDIKEHHHEIVPGEEVGYIELESGKVIWMVR